MSDAMDEKLQYARAALRKAQQDAWEKGQARLSAKQLAHVRSPKERSEDEPALEVPSSEQVWQAPPGIARGGTGPRPSRRDPKKVSVVASFLTRKNGWNKQLRSASIEAKWPEILGPKLLEHAQIETIQAPKLVIRASSTPWANALRMQIPTLLNRIDQKIGAGFITEVTILAPAAPKWTHGRLRVKGRGPRDTYG
ncbi:DciA family protein [Actinomycetales bacterium UMB0918]|uniref:DUF721 domain-containing protein n=1 Tax=Winkia sp. UMB0889B TaxID=3046315 RepID=UPI0015E0E512|nr:DciA family protein [Winkia sp. UMB0889B]MDK7906656.1 DciA family protein [Winkia sp. UMB0889B]